jgi:hypothetical protein
LEADYLEADFLEADFLEADFLEADSLGKLLLKGKLFWERILGIPSLGFLFG